MSLPAVRFCSIVMGWARKRIARQENGEQKLEQWMGELEMPLPTETQQVLSSASDETADGEAWLAMFSGKAG